MKFILLIKSEDKFNVLSPAEIQSTIAKYSAWAGKLRSENRLVDAEGLSNQGRILSGDNGVITDGPFVESKEMVGGYYVFTADSMDEAAAIARECPALGYGGSVELRSQMNYD